MGVFSCAPTKAEASIITVPPPAGFARPTRSAPQPLAQAPGAHPAPRGCQRHWKAIRAARVIDPNTQSAVAPGRDGSSKRAPCGVCHGADRDADASRVEAEAMGGVAASGQRSARGPGHSSKAAACHPAAARRRRSADDRPRGQSRSGLRRHRYGGR